MANTAIIDFGAGNMNSVKNALRYLGVQSTVTSKASEIRNAERVILPGVGAFGYMMKNLQKKKLAATIIEAIEQSKPFLGICLGMQALFEESEESSGIKGLSVFQGKVVKFRKGKVPQTGWNLVKPLRQGVVGEGYAYFVNSYYPEPKDSSIIAATSNYGGEFAAAIQRKNVLAVQFHPEKSGKYGLAILRKWLKC